MTEVNGKVVSEWQKFRKPEALAIDLFSQRLGIFSNSGVYTLRLKDGDSCASAVNTIAVQFLPPHLHQKCWHWRGRRHLPIQNVSTDQPPVLINCHLLQTIEFGFCLGS